MSGVDLPVGYELRAPTPDDFDAAAGVLDADDLDEAGEVVLGADFLRGQWKRAGFVLATDAWVIVDGVGTIVAYGQALLEEPTIVTSWGVVHPAQRGQGLGASLLDQIEERAAQLLAGVAAPTFRHAINAGDRAAAAMLDARGLQLARHFWHMGIDLEDAFEPRSAPEGIEIVGVEIPIDLPAVHAILADAFAEDWGYHPEPFDEWADDYASSPNYDPTLWLLARDRGTPVGALCGHAASEHGWVDEIGVLASHRGRGIAGALLRRSLSAFAERGVSRVVLNVDADNPTGATALYERVGMSVIRRWDLWAT